MLLSTARVDPITFQVIGSRLSGIVQEMQDNVFRTGYSTVVRESQDASCMLMDADGNVVGEHVVLPLHVSCLTAVVNAIRESFGDDIRSGDAFLTNHPYLSGVPHSMDIAVVTPVFDSGELIAFCGSIAHKTDLGGVVAGTANGNAREIFQEGIQFPPTLYERGGVVERDVEAIVRANSRTPDVVLGDIRGQVGVARLGERRLADTIAHYGRDAVLATFAERQNVGEIYVRNVLRSWPDGAHDGERFLDSGEGGGRIRFHVRVEKRGDRIAFDFSGSDDQSTGPINIRPPLVRGCIYYALIATIDPTMPNNGGLARVVDLTVRRGSIVDPEFPAATNTYMPTAIAVAEACIRALGEFASDRRTAGNSAGSGLSIGGRRPDGASFLQYELIGSAAGARVGSDGPSGVAVLLSNARAAPIEVLECEFPTRFRGFALIADSGGAGEFRGGLGARRTEEMLGTTQLTVRSTGHVVAAWGRDGGAPGSFARFTINPGTERAEVTGNRFSGRELHRGDVVADERGGGGGLGDPHRRPFAKILDDVLDGYVSRTAAIETYGVDAARLDAALAAWEESCPNR
jgi:N-methylhydantoinase B